MFNSPAILQNYDQPPQPSVSAHEAVAIGSYHPDDIYQQSTPDALSALPSPSDIYDQSVASVPVDISDLVPPQPELEYVDTKMNGQSVPPVLKFLTIQAFKDTLTAVEAKGNAREGLATILRERLLQEGNVPTGNDWLSAGEEAQGEWEKGKYDKMTFHGQVAKAIKQELEDDAEAFKREMAELAAGNQPVRLTLPYKLGQRVLELDEATDHTNTIPSNPSGELVLAAEQKWPSATAALDMATEARTSGWSPREF